jgi:hypothetical protein
MAITIYAKISNDHTLSHFAAGERSTNPDFGFLLMMMMVIMNTLATIRRLRELCATHSGEAMTTQMLVCDANAVAAADCDEVMFQSIIT